MSTTTSALDRIADLKSQIAALEKNALQELMDKRNSLSHELAGVDAEIARLSGKPVDGRKARATSAKVSSKAAGKSPSLQELKALLAAAPGMTIGIRRDGYDMKNIRTLANANPQLLSIGGKGAWPTVTLLK